MASYAPQLGLAVLGAMRNIVMLALVVALGIGGITLARQAFTNGIQTVIASEASSTPETASSPLSFPAIDTSCSGGLLEDKPVNVNRCHNEEMWAREAKPYVPETEPVHEMSLDDSEHTAMWFGVAMLAGLLGLGAIGAGAMWVLRE